MSAHDDDADRRLIDVLASLQRKRGEGELEPPSARGDFRTFARTGVGIIEVSRNTEHGVTSVQSLGFATDGARETALRLLHLPAIYDRLPQLYEYLRRQGCEGAREPRYFAAVAVSVLTQVLPFADLKEHVVLPWVKSVDDGGPDSAAIALAETLAAGRCEDDILALVRHWAKTGNPALAQAALATFTWRFTPARSEAALAAIEATMTTPVMWLLLLFGIRDLFRRIIEADPRLGITTLQRWLGPDQNAPLRLLSALLALEFLQLEDAVEGEDTRAAAVAVLGTLWDDSRLPLHPLIQEETTEKVKDWADRALALWDQDRPELFARYRQWFQALDERYRGQRRDRLRLSLERWDRLRERTAQRLTARPRAAAAAPEPRRPYRDLLGPD